MITDRSYEKPSIERFGTFRELTQWGCKSEYSYYSWGCHDDGGDKGDTGRS